jgi:hypothetical protein
MVVLYGVALAGICLVGLPLVFFSFRAGPVAGVGAILVLGSQVWLFTQIFTGSPAAALLVLLVPVLGSLLALKFIFDHWSIARWPMLCQVGGSVVWLVGLASHRGP